jgi:uncharacterized RDD family membrane protein YckC
MAPKISYVKCIPFYFTGVIIINLQEWYYKDKEDSGDSGEWLPAETYSELSPVQNNNPLVRPWIRYWARYLDTIVFVFLFGVVLEIMSLSDYFTTIEQYLLGILVLFIWIPVEALLISTLGTTLGKLLLGIKVRNTDGSKLSFQTAFKRSIYVWWRGQGAGLPIVSFVANLNGYQTLKHDLRQTTWDRDLNINVTHQQKIIWSEIFIYIIVALLVFNRCFAWLLKYK